MAAFGSLTRPPADRLKIPRVVTAHACVLLGAAKESMPQATVNSRYKDAFYNNTAV